MRMKTYGKSRQPIAKRSERYLTFKDLVAKGVCYHSNSLRRMWSEEPPRFPPPIYMSARKLAWKESVIDAWLAEKEAA